MSCEIVELKRCCFCVPLRYGLIVWSYLRLVMGLIAMGYFTFLLTVLLELSFKLSDTSLITTEFAIVAIVVLLLVIDNALCIIFIVAAHKKLHRVMRYYYIYQWITLTLAVPLTLTFFVLRLVNYSGSINDDQEIVKIIAQSAVEVINLVLQIYFIILLRSEIRKLNRNCQFKCSNNVEEAECAMVTTAMSDQSGEIPSKTKDSLEYDEKFDDKMKPYVNEKPTL